MSVRTVLAVTMAVLVSGFALAEPAVAEATVQPVAASVSTVSVGRVGASMSALVGLLGAVSGGLALARSTGQGRIGAWARRNGVVTALAAGFVALVVGGAVAATADGGLGTGNGLGGACFAMILGLLAVTLGGLARSRSQPSSMTHLESARSTPPRLTEGVAARLDRGVPAAAAAYDREDAACALAAGELSQCDGRGLPAPHEAGQEGRSVLLLDEAEVEQEVSSRTARRVRSRRCGTGSWLSAVRRCPRVPSPRGGPPVSEAPPSGLRCPCHRPVPAVRGAGGRRAGPPVRVRRAAGSGCRGIPRRGPGRSRGRGALEVPFPVPSA